MQRTTGFRRSPGIDGESLRQRPHHSFELMLRSARRHRINRETAERLISEGRMRRPGLAEVERARADGRWEAAYESQARSAIPEDLERALRLLRPDPLLSNR